MYVHRSCCYKLKGLFSKNKKQIKGTVFQKQKNKIKGLFFKNKKQIKGTEPAANVR